MKKPGRKREIRSPLQAVFLKRVDEEMKKQGISRNQLAQRVGAPPQTTLNDVMLGADPRLETVFGFAVALGVAPVSLLTESTTQTGIIYKLPVYPKIATASEPATSKKRRDRKKPGM
jgi:transcriptional regulator with XRE-family HTH domain